MYRIDTDKTNKLILIELSGQIEISEWRAYINEVINTSLQFNKKELVILISMEKLETLSQESIPVCIKGLHIASEYTKKIAFVHKKVLTRMQLNKILSAVNNLSDDTFHARLFTTKREAMIYLLSNENY